MNSTDPQDQNHGCEIILIADKLSCVSHALVPCTDVTLTTADVLGSSWQKFATTISNYLPLSSELWGSFLVIKHGFWTIPDFVR